MTQAILQRMESGRRTGLAGATGSLLEWYDFTVYGFLAPILGKLFFPADDQVASLLAAFGVFAIGYAARPVGGAIFGHIGDKFGRKPAMIASAMMMGLATLGIGLLPDHAQIGTAAAVLLVVFRVLQGLSVGGEFTDSVVMLAEQAPDDRRGFVASWAEMGGIVGMLLGSGIGAVTSNVIGEAEMQAWGWRIPFLLGAVIAVFSVILRRQITESPALEHVERAAGSPVVVALRHYWRPILRMVCLLLMQGIGFYMVFVYAASYLTDQMHFTTARALDINTLALLAMLVGAPAAAIASDHIGRKPVLYFVVVATFVLAWPLWALMHHQSFALILCGQIGFGALMGLAFGVTPATMIEMLPTEVRCSGVAIGYNLCFGMFGGTTPLIATYLVARTADDFTPAYYLMAVTLVSFIVLLGLPETARKPLR
jgi:MFS transporter, MHS family, proline/betaine transporter